LKGWHNEPYRHSLAAHGIRTRGIEVPGNFPIVDSAIRSLVEGDRWDLSIEPKKEGQYEDMHTIIINPILIPGVKLASVGWLGSESAVDFNIAYIEDLEDDEYIGSTAKLDPESGYSDKIPAEEDGNLYRGMSWEEFQFVLRNGFIQSDYSYNFPSEIGLTYYSEDPTTAGSYGGSFQPYHMQPTFERPGYVIKIKKQLESGINRERSIGTNEIAVIGSIPIGEILEIYEIRPYQISPGYVEIREVYGETGKVYREGSRMSPSVRVGYKKMVLGDVL